MIGENVIMTKRDVTMIREESRRTAMTHAYIVKGHVKDKKDNGKHTSKRTGGT